MAKVLGPNLKAEDDYMHPLGPEPNFNESMYFNFFDASQSIGGFVRMGNRANEHNAEMTVTLYARDGRVLFMFKRPQIENNDAFDAGGLRFEVLEPGQLLHTVYEGSLLDMKDPTQMADPKEAFANNPRIVARIDLEHDAVGPMYGSAGSDAESDLPADQQFARAHYEQHMAVKGTIQLGDETLEINGYGLRDHSWGPRYWQAIESYEWLTMNFGPDFGAMVSIVRRDAEHQRRGGVIIRGDELIAVRDAEITAEFADNGLYHKTVHAKLTTQDGEVLEIDGTVKGFIPLRNRRDGLTTHIGEGMTEWHCGDQTGYGLSEFLRQV
jgi:hypothetical protein